jgi:hypothetical protein
MEKCKHCGKSRGNHQSSTGLCPVGRRSRVGYISFHGSNVFEPRKPREAKKRPGKHSNLVEEKFKLPDHDTFIEKCESLGIWEYNAESIYLWLVEQF